MVLLLAVMGWSQVTPGRVVEYQRVHGAVLFRMESGALRLEICTPSMVHVMYSPDGAFPKHPNPMIVRTEWPDAPFDLAEDDRRVTLSTGKVRVSIARGDGAIEFTDASGARLFHAEGDYGGVRMTPAAVNGEPTYRLETVFFPESGEAFYGLGQHHAGVWNYSGESVDLSQDNTNISVPFFLSSLGYGVFWNNPSQSRFNNRFARHLYIDSDVADTLDYYFLYGPGPDRIIAAYRDLTGPAPLFGKWAYGFWQCKNRYKTSEEIVSAARKYRQLAIPVDNIVQDWRWWTRMGSFVFNKNYPDPKGMVEALHKLNFHVMISVWPTFQTGSAPYERFRQPGWNIGEYGSAMPGAVVYDPFRKEVGEYYWKLISESLFRIGFDAWWLDTTEPETLFLERSMMLDAQTGLGGGARYANLYPLMSSAGVFDGQIGETRDQRVFILTRSAAPGMQRYAAAAWSGDIFSTWSTLKRQIPAGLNYSLSGLPYWTTDIGGFVSGNPDDPAYRELFIRWFQYGSFCPIFRTHGTRDNGQNELWSYGKQAQAILTDYDVLRYRLLPYIYSTAWRVTQEGYTMMRPLVMDYRSDPIARETGDQFLFGPSLLINPVTDPGVDSRRLYLPAGTWYDFWTGDPEKGGRFHTAAAPLETIPVYVPAGSIIPLGPPVQYAAEKPADPIELRVYPGAEGDFVLYEDDGTTYSYEKGERATIPLHWDDARRKLTIGARQGAFPGMLPQRTFRIVWVAKGHGTGVAMCEEADAVVQYRGHAITVDAPGGSGAR